MVLHCLPSKIAQQSLAGSNGKVPCSPKAIFHIDGHYKRDDCKAVDRTPQTLNKVNDDCVVNF